jgi:hypothetical protein
MSFLPMFKQASMAICTIGVWLHNEAHHDRKNDQECCIMMLVQGMVVESKDKHGAFVPFL